MTPVSAASLHTFEALRWRDCRFLATAMHSMHGENSDGACREVQYNNISGSLPTEIGQLSSLTNLYDPLVSTALLWTLRHCNGEISFCLAAAIHSMREGGKPTSTLPVLAGTSTRTTYQARCLPRSAS